MLSLFDYLSQINKYNLKKQIKDQKIRSENVKLPQGNIEGKLPNTGMSNNFSDPTPGMPETEAKIHIRGDSKL